MEKLVRDHVPDILRAEGRFARVRAATPEELPSLLQMKLIEEAHEYASAPSLEELADVLEVVRALLNTHGWSFRELETKAEAKHRERGGFTHGWVLSLDEA